MHVIIMGAGLMGVTTAYYLAREGHQVTVVDRRTAVAQETSFANAGLLTPGHAAAWASPRAPMILLQSLWRKDTSLRYRLKLDPSMWAWTLQFLANCTAERNRANTLIKLRLCLHSQHETDRVTRETGIAWDRTSKGALYLHRNKGQMQAAQSNFAMMHDEGIKLRTLSMEDVVALEPALAPSKDKLVGAIYVESDESGDARKFTEALADICRGLGVTFRLNERIDRIAGNSDGITGVQSQLGELKGDAYVLALGSYSPQLVRPLGLKLPVYPVKGYSVTVPLREAAAAPTIGGVDEQNLVAFSRLGNRMRLTGTADFCGYDTEFEAHHFTHMLKVARELFPQGGAYDQPDYWACLRPMTPDGPPIIGRSAIPNLWLNTGQGHMGWTMACGSSQILSDLMANRKPAIDPGGFRPDRY
ncbi:D-amino acid dehydrogenase [Dongia soli]|uniref:D-amino acid dehydrogenase n=1 Tax=Dongia soli TaxID=600628 RepID=A0ABU5EHT6_9PROT|nr:D-amino acid dehydrogenase [Dongia soli]MDY0885867.1 D-amino acid dehydrogenase [Dongia soli]